MSIGGVCIGNKSDSTSIEGGSCAISKLANYPISRIPELGASDQGNVEINQFSGSQVNHNNINGNYVNKVYSGVCSHPAGDLLALQMQLQGNNSANECDTLLALQRNWLVLQQEQCFQQFSQKNGNNLQNEIIRDEDLQNSAVNQYIQPEFYEVNYVRNLLNMNNGQTGGQHSNIDYNISGNNSLQYQQGTGVPFLQHNNNSQYSNLGNSGSQFHSIQGLQGENNITNLSAHNLMLANNNKDLLMNHCTVVHENIKGLDMQSNVNAHGSSVLQKKVGKVSSALNSGVMSHMGMQHNLQSGGNMQNLVSGMPQRYDHSDIRNSQHIGASCIQPNHSNNVQCHSGFQVQSVNEWDSIAPLRNIPDLSSMLDLSDLPQHIQIPKYYDGVRISLGEAGREILRCYINQRGVRGKFMSSSNLQQLLRVAHQCGLWNAAVRLHLEFIGEIAMTASHAEMRKYKSLQTKRRLSKRISVLAKFGAPVVRTAGGEETIEYRDGMKLSLGVDGRKLLLKKIREARSRREIEVTSLFQKYGLKYSQLRNATIHELCKMAYVCGLWDEAVKLHFQHIRKRGHDADNDNNYGFMENEGVESANVWCVERHEADDTNDYDELDGSDFNSCNKRPLIRQNSRVSPIGTIHPDLDTDLLKMSRTSIAMNGGPLDKDYFVNIPRVEGGNDMDDARLLGKSSVLKVKNCSLMQVSGGINKTDAMRQNRTVTSSPKAGLVLGSGRDSSPMGDASTVSSPAISCQTMDQNDEGKLIREGQSKILGHKQLSDIVPTFPSMLQVPCSAHQSSVDFGCMMYGMPNSDIKVESVSGREESLATTSTTESLAGNI